jgi:hypothetical protein
MKLFKNFLKVIVVLSLLQLAWMEYLRMVLSKKYNISTARVEMGGIKYTAIIKREKDTNDPITVVFYLNNNDSFTTSRAFSLLNYRQGRFIVVDATGEGGIKYLPKPIEVAYQFNLNKIKEGKSWFYSHYSYLCPG